MPFLGPGRDFVTQMIVSILGAMTAIQVGNMIYTEPELSLTIAAGAGRHPIRAFDHFFNPFSSPSRISFTSGGDTDEVNHPDVTISDAATESERDLYTVTANNPIEDTVSEDDHFLNTVPTNLGKNAKTSPSSSYMSAYLSEQQLSNSNVQDVPSFTTSLDSIQSSDENQVPKSFTSAQNDHMDTAASTVPLNQQDHTTATSNGNPTSQNIATTKRTGDLALIPDTPDSEHETPWSNVPNWLKQYFKTLRIMLAIAVTRNALFVTVAFAMFIAYNRTRSGVKEAAKEEAEANLRREMEDVRSQLKRSEEIVAGHDEVLQKEREYNKKGVGKVVRKYLDENSDLRSQIRQLKYEATSKDSEIAKLQGEALSNDTQYKQRATQLQADVVSLEEENRRAEASYAIAVSERRKLKAELAIVQVEATQLKSKVLSATSRNIELLSKVKNQRQLIADSFRREFAYHIAVQWTKSKIDRLDSEIILKADEIETLTIEGGVKDEKYAALSRASKTNAANAKDLKESLENLSSQIKEKNATIRDHEDTVTDLMKKLEQNEQTIKQYQTSSQQGDSTMEQLQIEKDELHKQAEILTAELKVAKSKAEQLEQDNQNLTNDIQAEKSKVQDLERQNRSQQTEWKTASSKMYSQKKKIERLEDAAKSFSITTAFQNNDLQAEKDKVRELEEEKQTLATEKEALATRLAEKQREVEALEIKRDDLELELSSKTEELQAEKEKVVKLDNEAKSLRDQSERPAEDTLVIVSEPTRPEHAIEGPDVKPVTKVEIPESGSQPVDVTESVKSTPTATSSKPKAKPPGVSVLAINIKERNGLSDSVQDIQKRLNNGDCGICGGDDHESGACPQRKIENGGEDGGSKKGKEKKEKKKGKGKGKK